MLKFGFIKYFQCLVDYEGDSDEDDDEDNAHMSKKARIE